MRYYRDYYENQKQERIVDILTHRQKLIDYGYIVIIDENTIYVKDNLNNVARGELTTAVLRMYSIVISSPEIWHKFLNV